MSETRISIVGGGIAGLIAAKEAEKEFDNIVLYDEGDYEGDRRGPWGELIWNYSMMELDRNIPGYVREVEKGIFDHKGNETEVNVDDGVIINRGELEKYIDKNLDKTEIKENTRIDENRFFELAGESDLLIDASGPFPVSNYFNNLEYDSVVPTISGRIEGDFSDLYPEPRGIGYKNYFLWIVPQNKKEATVGLGCLPQNNSEELDEDLVQMLKEYNIKVPETENLYRGVDVSSSAENLKKCSYRLNNCDVMIVGSAAGLSNSNTRFGLTHAARSARLAINSFKNDSSYTEKLISENKYRLRSQNLISPLQKNLGGLKTLSYITQRDLDYSSIFEPESNTEIVGNFKGFMPSFSLKDRN